MPFDPFHDHAQPAVPFPPARTAGYPAPQFHLPARRAVDNRRYLLWSTDGFPLLVNGRSSLVPTFTGDLIEDMKRFPNRRTVSVLRKIGVRASSSTPTALPDPVAGRRLEAGRRTAVDQDRGPGRAGDLRDPFAQGGRRHDHSTLDRLPATLAVGERGQGRDRAQRAGADQI